MCSSGVCVCVLNTVGVPGQSTANFTAAKALFDRVTFVPADWLPLRELVVAKRKARAMFVQVSTSRT